MALKNIGTEDVYFSKVRSIWDKISTVRKVLTLFTNVEIIFFHSDIIIIIPTVVVLLSLLSILNTFLVLPMSLIVWERAQVIGNVNIHLRD